MNSRDVAVVSGFPGVRLFCFAHAGGGALTFAGWKSQMPAWIDLCPVILPGRENLGDEGLITSLDELIEVLMRTIAPRLDRPFAFYGHSLGALLGFELTRALKKVGGPEPVHLFVGAHRAPHLSYPFPRVAPMSDQELIDHIKTFEGLTDAVLKHPDFKRVFLPVLRADLQVCDSYSYQAGSKIECPLTAVAGRFDKVVPMEMIEPWAEHCQGRFAMEIIGGAHFFLRTHRDELLDLIRSELVETLKRRAKENGNPDLRVAG